MHNWSLNPRRCGKLLLRGLQLTGVAYVCGSCAEFPTNSGPGNFTAITFSFSVKDMILDTVSSGGSDYYIYDVAIATSSAKDPSISIAPLPVINSSNPNGRVAGSPNFLIEYNSLNPTTSLPFTLYRFALASEDPNQNDPTNTVNLGVYPPATRGQIINFTTPETGGDPASLTFTVYTNELADTDAEAKSLRWLFVNILTMTRVSNLGSGARVYDALGPTNTAAGLTDFLQVNLLQSAPYNNANGFEISGDTLGGTDPDVDIINYSVTISHP